MTREWLRVGALGMAVVLAGCAAAPPKPALEAFEPESQPAAECTTHAPSGNGAARLGRAVGYGALGIFLGALQGAGEGANWAWGSGGSRSDAVWIGAAAGASMGFLIGFVTGLAKAGSGFSVEPASTPPCPPASAETTVLAEDNLETASTR
jgi:hypothetical protein